MSAFLRDYGFWILCGLGVLCMIAIALTAYAELLPEPDAMKAEAYFARGLAEANPDVSSRRQSCLAL